MFTQTWLCAEGVVCWHLLFAEGWTTPRSSQVVTTALQQPGVPIHANPFAALHPSSSFCGLDMDLDVEEWPRLASSSPSPPPKRARVDAAEEAVPVHVPDSGVGEDDMAWFTPSAGGGNVGTSLPSRSCAARVVVSPSKRAAQEREVALATAEVAKRTLRRIADVAQTRAVRRSLAPELCAAAQAVQRMREAQSPQRVDTRILEVDAARRAAAPAPAPATAVPGQTTGMPAAESCGERDGCKRA